MNSTTGRLLLGIASFGWSASAQEKPEPSPVELESMIVTASPFAISKEELVVPVSSLTGSELERTAQASLGATLDGEPGVHSTYFGPGSGRPVIRGFDGDRVRILNQGTDSFDVSQTSPDHGVSIEPLFARDIEIIRGPASLLYGNAAIGGVVNVIGKELPRERTARRLLGQFESVYGSVADSFSAGTSLEGGTDDFAWSVGYLERSAEDHEIPGLAESVYQMQAEGEAFPNEAESEEGYGVLENSFSDTRSAYAGGTRFFNKGSLGISYSEYNADYGVPGHAHDSEEGPHGEEAVAIDLEQSRLSLRAELLEPGQLLENVEIQFGYGDYRHMELAEKETGTIFERKGGELRITGTHVPRGKLTGAIGIHLKEDSFSAIGEEAFIPTNQSSSRGLFLVERLNTSWGAWEFGGRLDLIEVDPEDTSAPKRKFTSATGSAGLVRRLSDASILSANFTYAERAPNASELFAFGPHAGTQSFEIGNATLETERSLNFDLGLRQSAGKATGELTVFFSDFRDYVYLQGIDIATATAQYGELNSEGLNVLQAAAADARFYGFELELRFHFLEEDEQRVHFDLLIDQTRAWNESLDAQLPRIPTRRIGGRFEREAGPWLMGIEGRHSEAASRLAPNELPTDSYFLWSADTRYRFPSAGSSATELYLIGRNLANAEARAHTSFLKDLLPLPGRSIELGLKTTF